MTRKILLVAASAVILALGVSSPAPADVRPPYPTEPAPAAPALENPVTGVLEAGRLIITVATTRRLADGPSVNYGYRTGQSIPITIVISADPEIVVDTGALANKTLNKDGSKFEMVAPPVVTTRDLNGKHITIIQLVVRSWMMDTVLTFNCQFHYATGLLPDGTTPAWKLATTPDFVITTSRTATESSKELLNGDMSVKVTPRVWWSQPLEYTGGAVMLCIPLWMLYLLWCNFREERKLSRAERAWKVIDHVMDQRGSAGADEFTPTQLKLISAALREYLEIESIATQFARQPLERFFDSHELGIELIELSLSALAKLDRSIYGQSRLTGQETAALLQELARIIPRLSQ